MQFSDKSIGTQKSRGKIFPPRSNEQERSMTHTIPISRLTLRFYIFFFFFRPEFRPFNIFFIRLDGIFGRGNLAGYHLRGHVERRNGTRRRERQVNLQSQRLPETKRFVAARRRKGYSHQRHRQHQIKRSVTN